MHNGAQTDPVRVLIVEDNALDAELMREELRRIGVCTTTVRVQTGAALAAELSKAEPDIILSDYQLPRFSGPEVLEMVGRDYPHVPVILVTGAIDEATAIESLRAGAIDYVLKDNLVRLGPAVVRALDHRRDRAEKQRAQDDLAASEARFRGFAELATDAVVIADADGSIQFWNEAAKEIFGYSAAEALRLHVAALMPERYRDRHQLGWKRTVRAGATMSAKLRTEVAALRKDGSEFPADLSLVSFRDNGGVSVSAVVRDLTQRHAAEKMLEESRARYKTLVEHLPAILYDAALDEQCSTIWVSPQVEEMLGTKPGDFVQDPGLFLERIHPDDREDVLRASRRARSAGEVLDIEYRMFHTDGSVRWFRDRARVLVNESGEPTCMQGVMLDVTDSKEAERGRELLSAAIEQASDMVVITDPDGRIQYVNSAFQRITGYSEEEVVGENPRILKGGVHTTDFYETMWSHLTEGVPWTTEFTNRRKDGSLYKQRSTIFPVKSPAGRIVNYVGLGQDVTSERDLEDQLRQAQKMEAVGQLTAGIAHDFNNMLAIILVSAELMALSLAPDQEKLRKSTNDIRTAAKQGADLIRKLMTFSRNEPMTLESLHLKELVEETLPLVRVAIPESVDLRVSLAEDGAPCHVDRRAMQQIIMNLATNARDAMDGDGVLSITTEYVRTCDDTCKCEAGGFPEGCIRLAVGDTGCGMNEETKSRIFEPFYTTKEREHGTGLGLSMVHGLVEVMEGQVHVESEVGKGTTISVCLPLLPNSETGA